MLTADLLVLLWTLKVRRILVRLERENNFFNLFKKTSSVFPIQNSVVYKHENTTLFLAAAAE